MQFINIIEYVFIGSLGLDGMSDMKQQFDCDGFLLTKTSFVVKQKHSDET